MAPIKQTDKNEALVKLANDLLQQLHVSRRVKRLSDINTSVFITLYEGLCGEEPAGLVKPGKTRKQEIHNCQCVIDSLANDVVNTSLSHIDGGDVVRGDFTAVSNLLEVFSGLFEYILDKIGSDISTDQDDADSEGTLEDLGDIDPDMVTPEVIDKILQKELGKDYHSPSKNSMTKSPGPNATETTAELIAQAQASDITAASMNNTSDLIALGYTPSGHRSPARNHANGSSRHAPPTSTHTTTATATPHSDHSESEFLSLHYSTSTSNGDSGNSTSALIREASSLEKQLYGPNGEPSSFDNHTFSMNADTSGTYRTRTPSSPHKPLSTATHNTTYDATLYNGNASAHPVSHKLDAPAAAGVGEQDTQHATSSSRPLSSMTHRQIYTQPTDASVARPATLSAVASARLDTTRSILAAMKENVHPHTQLGALSSPSSYSYDNLRALVESTVQMSREAISANTNNNAADSSAVQQAAPTREALGQSQQENVAVGNHDQLDDEISLEKGTSIQDSRSSLLINGTNDLTTVTPLSRSSDALPPRSSRVRGSGSVKSGGEAGRASRVVQLSQQSLASTNTSCNTSEVEDDVISTELRKAMRSVHKESRQMQKLSTNLNTTQHNRSMEDKTTQSLLQIPDEPTQRKVSFQTDTQTAHTQTHRKSNKDSVTSTSAYTRPTSKPNNIATTGSSSSARLGAASRSGNRSTGGSSSSIVSAQQQRTTTTKAHKTSVGAGVRSTRAISSPRTYRSKPHKPTTRLTTAGARATTANKSGAGSATAASSNSTSATLEQQATTFNDRQTTPGEIHEQEGGAYDSGDEGSVRAGGSKRYHPRRALHVPTGSDNGQHMSATQASTTTTTGPTTSQVRHGTYPQSYQRECDARVPRTFPEYLEKYYSTVDRRDDRRENHEPAYHDISQHTIEGSDDDGGFASQHSDTEIDYRAEKQGHEHRARARGSRSPDRMTSARLQPYASSTSPARIGASPSRGERVGGEAGGSVSRSARGAVRFDDVLDEQAGGQIGDIRRKLKREEGKARSRTQLLNRVYKDDLYSYTEAAEDQLDLLCEKAAEKEYEYRTKVFGKQARSYPSGKYKVTTSVVKPRSGARSKTRKSATRSTSSNTRQRSLSAGPVLATPTKTSHEDGDLLPWLLEEFPFLHLTTETLHDLWRKSSRQIDLLSKAAKDTRRRKSRAQLQAEEAERRQQILIDIMKKELTHNDRLKELKDRRVAQNQVKSRLRDKRLQSARARKYYEEFQVGMRSKMMKKKTKEEMLFKKLFKQGLDVQKERVRELRKYAAEQRKERTRRQQQELEALENYYRDQFEMLSQSMQNERKDLDVREKAQAKILEKMKRELRNKMEHEIREIQERITRDEDDEYFRQLDADRLTQRLQLARFQGKI